MRAGALRLVGMLQDRSTARDAYGGQETAWRDICKVRFALEAAGGHEIDFGGSIRSQSSYKLSMRWRPGVKPTMRVVMGDRIFNFTNVTDLEERHRELDITVVEGVSPGQAPSA